MRKRFNEIARENGQKNVMIDKRLFALPVNNTPLFLKQCKQDLKAISLLLDNSMVKQINTAFNKTALKAGGDTTVLNFSKKGQSIYDQIVPAGLDFEAKLMSVMNANDLEQIHRLLKKLASRLNKI